MEGKNILVIDDESDLLEIMQILLQEKGYSVQVAGSAEEGIKKAKEFIPSVILLDLMMPGVDGFEVCRQLKSQTITSKIPIVALTALGEEEATKRAMKMGFAGYVVKPFDGEILLTSLQEALAKQEK